MATVPLGSASSGGEKWPKLNKRTVYDEYHREDKAPKVRLEWSWHSEEGIFSDLKFT